MKETFYIFLDIDGVLYDWKYIKSLAPEYHGGIIKKFDPESIEALNYLIEKLEKDYCVELVISSSWRINMKVTLETLVSNGADIKNINVSKIGDLYNPHYRGREILKYLENKRNKENYVIIDDEMFDFKECFSLDRIVKTDLFADDLKKDMIDIFLQNNIKKKR